MHQTKVINEGEGMTESAQVVCSCGWQSPKVYAYASHYYTNQHQFKHDHLQAVKDKK